MVTSLPSIKTWPPVVEMDAGNDLHHGGFSGAVLTHESVDGAGLQLEVHPVEDLDAVEGFSYPFQFH